MPPDTATGPNPPTPVLSTLNEDGSRRWLKPRLSPGRFLRRRRVVAYILIAIFTLLPYIDINGKPAILLDIPARRFTFFGMTFLPTDTLLLALFVVGIFVAVFLLTALFGRVWCGWACPQTVYMEFVFRPIERLFEGAPGRKYKGPIPAGLRKPLKYGVYLLVSLYLAHTFLAYFVGVDALAQWVQRSPLEHPTSFMVMAATTGLMMFDFCFFREQTCIVACPYGRFQSVMLDRDSLIVTYDDKRGEPRGKRRQKAVREESGKVSLKVVGGDQGDCVDCHMCVVTCPTGIDIRDGLQMECIGCAQCIDACDHVMDKIGRPRGLIRYSTQSRIAGEKPRFARPRVVIYPLALAVIATLFGLTLAGKSEADITLLRGFGLPYVLLDAGDVSNEVRVKIVNRTDEDAVYRVVPAEGSPVRLVSAEGALEVPTPAGESTTMSVRVAAPRDAFTKGELSATFVITGPGDFRETRPYTLLGPKGPPPMTQTPQEESP